MPSIAAPQSRERAERVALALGVFFKETGVPVIVVTPDGCFVAVNRAAVDQYGYPLDELLGMRIHDLIGEGYTNVDVDLTLASRDRHAVLERRPHKRKDGSILWVVPTAAPLVVGGESYIVSVLTDVTAVLVAERRVRQLEALAQSDRERAELLWQAASERLTDGVALLDDGLRVVRCNSALSVLLARPAEAMLGLPCREVFPMCERESPCLHQRALATQLREVREIHGRISNRPLRIEVIPAPGSRPHFSLVHTAHDLREERGIRSRLITADRLASIGRLAAGVAHEVNNPAAFVTVNLGVLRDRLASGAARSADMLAMLDESLQGMERIRDIVRDLKGFARERSREKVDLSAVIATALRMAAHETEGRARVDRELEPGLHAYVRGARVAQVILNLVVNAAQAIPAGQPAAHRIVVRAWREGDRAKIEVCDTGTGIPAEVAEQIFEPFFTTRERAGGTGLGLWLARAIVEEEGGTIEASNTPGAGACFTLALPLWDPAALPDVRGQGHGPPTGVIGS
jgi:PAS domain S-box-containing protein